MSQSNNQHKADGRSSAQGNSKSVAPKLRYRAEREFGLIVGSVFTLLGGLWLYLDKFGWVAKGKLIFGVTLILVGLVVPRALVHLRRGWMALAELIFSIITKVTLSLLYVLVFAPFGFVMRLRGWDPLLRRAASAHTYWSDYSERQSDARHYEKMY